MSVPKLGRVVSLVVAGALIVPVVAGGAWAGTLTPKGTASVSKQLAELKGPDSQPDQDFGASVDISGTTIAIGADTYHTPAMGYVFSHSADGWGPAAGLTVPDFVTHGDFSSSPVVSGSTAVVGQVFADADGAGLVWVFAKAGSGWEETAELKSPDRVMGADFGGAVAVATGVIVVGSQATDGNTGKVYIYDRAGAGWQETAELRASNGKSEDEFGGAVAISGTTIVVGAPGCDSEAGRVYVFKKSAAGWHQTAELKGSDTVGSPSPGSGDQFGASVGISGATIVVGAEEHNYLEGAAYVFSESPTGWHQIVELKGADTASGDAFGAAVGISGTTIVVGAYNHNHFAGAAYVFTLSPTGWRQVAELKGQDTVANDYFGRAVAISGTGVVVGAEGHAHNSGRVYVFRV